MLKIVSIRFAAPPVGALRWQAPQPPTWNRSQAINASNFAPQCPQSAFQPLQNTGNFSTEDCLFLNIYAPPNASNLPVLVWIHGGGYGLGNGQEDLSGIITANNNSFIGVAIQYRVSSACTWLLQATFADPQKSWALLASCHLTRCTETAL